MKNNPVDIFLSLIFPNKCPYCRKTIKPDMTECKECFESFPQHPKKMITSAGISCIAPFGYHSKIRDSIIDFKFNGNSFNAKSYSKALCNTIEYFNMLDDFDLITFVPLSKKRKNERGFDQSELVAEYVGKYLDKKVKALLKKTRQTKNQHELNSAQRAENVRNIYTAVNAGFIKEKNILLIDDIATTGNTLSECCRVLKENGAKNIICMTIAITGAV